MIKTLPSSLKIVLEESGLFEVDAFDDPIRELASFKPNGYDVLVLDVKMGDIDGFKVYRKLKTIDEKIKICFQHLSTTLITTGCIQR